MLKYTITGDNITISDRERAYIEKRFQGFHRFVAEGVPRDIFITASKSTVHQREDSVRVEVKFKTHQKDFFAAGEAVDIIGAADKAKEELMRSVTQSKAKSITLFHRGARKVKALMKAGLRRK